MSWRSPPRLSRCRMCGRWRRGRVQRLRGGRRRLRSGHGLGATRQRSRRQRRSDRRRARRATAVQARGRGRGSRARAARLPSLLPRSGVRACAGRASSRVRRRDRSSSVGGGCSVRAVDVRAASPVRHGGDRGRYDHAAQLHERPPAHFDRSASCDQQQPQRLASLPAPRQCGRVAGECRACGTDRVEWFVFAA